MTTETLTALRLHDCRFERFGTAILPVDDMTPHSDRDAQLVFESVDLRYYVMRLRQRPAVLLNMTRHKRATQCLGSADALAYDPCTAFRFTMATSPAWQSTGTGEGQPGSATLPSGCSSCVTSI